MNNLKNNKGQLMGAITGVMISYFFSVHWFTTVQPTGVGYKLLAPIVIYILIQGSASIGRQYVDKK